MQEPETHYKYVVYNAQRQPVACTDDLEAARHAALTFARKDKEGLYTACEAKPVLQAKYCKPCHVAKAEVIT